VDDKGSVARSIRSISRNSAKESLTSKNVKEGMKSTMAKDKDK